MSGIRASEEYMGYLIPFTWRKEGGGLSSIQCLMLTSSNYTVWAMRMKIMLKVHKVWEVIETESADGDKNDMATALLFQFILEALILQVGELDTAKKSVGCDQIKRHGSRESKGGTTTNVDG